MAYPIQQTLWESIDGILFNKALALAKDIAAELGVPSQDLITMLKREDRSKFSIIQEDETIYQCQALVQRGLIQMRCRNPTLGPAPRLCSCHVNDKYSLEKSKLPELQRVVTADTVYFSDGQRVYDANAKQCGSIKGSTLTVFEISD
jgi:hypothetical protein